MSHFNPLLDLSGLPRFNDISVAHVKPALEAVIESARGKLSTLEQLGGHATWDNFVAPLQELEDQIDRVWKPVSHLNSVMDSAAFRKVYDECLAALTDFSTDLGQNAGLFRGFQAIAGSNEFQGFDIARRRVVDNALRDFRLGGVVLEGEERARFKLISERLSELGNRFSQNLLDATDDWSMSVEEGVDTQGLPQSVVGSARQEAEDRDQQGLVFTLKAPSYLPFMTYAENRGLRRQMYEAYVTRASEIGPSAGRFDNSATMDEILRLRHEKAALLGFASYAEYSLETKMATSVEEVRAFLIDLAERSLPAARRELTELQTFATTRHGLDRLEAWDLAFYSEKLKQERYELSEEALRPWFPLPKVLDGMFAVVNRLFGVTVRPVPGVQLWHESARFFEIIDGDGGLRGRFYVDLHSRAHKRGGAWMAGCVTRRRSGSGIQHPVAFLVCNFTPPVGTRPTLLTHYEVTTLFHEFGHGLHHMLTRVEEPSVSGIHGVAWDAVELPSQFLENFCWEREALDLISAHHETGKPLPADMLDKLKAGRNFQSAMQMLRQIEFALFDLELHDTDEPESVQSVLDAVRDRVAVVPVPDFNRFQNSFSHIFGGGYAAGYYSYKWAEVLSADAFGKFEENGIFDPETGKSFLVNILESGGTRDAMDLFVAFRGRKPDVAALLRHSGLAA